MGGDDPRSVATAAGFGNETGDVEATVLAIGDWRKTQQEGRSYVNEAIGYADVPQNCCGCTSRRDEEVMGE